MNSLLSDLSIGVGAFASTNIDDIFLLAAFFADPRLCHRSLVGATFDVLHAGLPQRDAYDMVYRHGMDISADGVHLAAGSTTGSLWVSDNSGESWQTVGVNLPPIYAVRFI